MCLLAVSAQQCTMPAISAHDLRLNHRRFNQTRMASVLAGEGGRHGHPPGQPGGPAAHHQLCALHPLLCRAEAHRRAVPWALQGLPRSFSPLSTPLAALQLDQFPNSCSTSQGTWGHLQYGHTCSTSSGTLPIQPRPRRALPRACTSATSSRFRSFVGHPSVPARGVGRGSRPRASWLQGVPGRKAFVCNACAWCLGTRVSALCIMLAHGVCIQSILRGQLLQHMPSWADPVPVAVNDTLSVLQHTHRVGSFVLCLALALPQAQTTCHLGMLRSQCLWMSHTLYPASAHCRM